MNFENLETRLPLTGTIDSIELIQDTGVSSTDEISREAAVEGTVQGSGNYWVEFDHHRDGTIDAVVAVSNGEFSYDPLSVDSALMSWDGAFDMDYRLKEDNGGAVTYSNWETHSITLDRVGPVVASANPASGSIVNDTQQVLDLTFSEAIAGSSINSSQVTVIGSGSINQTIAAPTATTAEITLQQSLTAGTYTTQLTDVEDLAGNQLSDSWSWMVNESPTVTTINDIVVSEGTSLHSLDLSQHFSDLEDSNLSFVVSEQNSSNLFSNISVSGNHVTFNLAPSSTGSSLMTVTGTDSNGAFVTTSFLFTIDAKPVITEFEIYQDVAGNWRAAGKITDEQPGQATIHLTGTIETTISVNEDGTFNAIIAPPGFGTVIAVATDALAQESEEEYEVISP